jgi:hypothetical protein
VVASVVRGGVLAVVVVVAGGAVLGRAASGCDVHDAASKMTSKPLAMGVLRLTLMIDDAIIS